MISEIPTSEIVHDEVEVLLVLKGAAHVDEEGMVQLAEDPALVEDGFDVVLLDHSAWKGEYFFLEIYFMAHSRRFYFWHTFQTLPKPPKPIW